MRMWVAIIAILIVGQFLPRLFILGVSVGMMLAMIIGYWHRIVPAINSWIHRR